MERRNFIATIASATAIAALPVVSLAARPSTFNDDDTLVQRTEKLNALMGTSYEVDVSYPKEWETWRVSTSRDELLAAQFPRLVWNTSNPFQWSVHLKHNGKQCTHDMSPLEFFHYTSQVAWEYRVRKR